MSLAASRFRQGFTAEAVALQTEALRLVPDDAVNAERLAAYRADSERPKAVSPPAELTSAPHLAAPSAADPLGDWPQRRSAFDWEQLGDRLTHDGCVVIERLVDDTSGDEIRGLFDRDDLFAKTVVLDRPEFGQGVYR